ncbi:MAG: radical SAM protein [Myxococcales bacterium]
MYVTEIFESIQGETTESGRPCAFVRFTGCDLRCGYCDSAYAFHGGKHMSREQILAALEPYGTRFVTLTGGEPLLQKELPELCGDLLARGWEVSIETHGQRRLDRIPAGVARIIDVKTPDSKEETKDFFALQDLRAKDQVKFVVCSEADFRWSLEIIRRFELESRCPVLLSPSWGQVNPKDLVRWMLESKVKARLNLQIHKYIWGPEVTGV